MRVRIRLLRTLVVAATFVVAALPPAAGASVVGPTPASQITAASPLQAKIRLWTFVTGLDQPVYATGSRDGTSRLFIVEKTGRIKIWKGPQLYATPYLDIHTLVSNGSEQGLLGLAVSPGFKTNHRLYIDYTNTSGNTVIAEYRQSTSNPNVVDPATRRVILTIAQPYANHNGGMLAFGPDGYLYIGMGDGGSAGDPGNRAQSTGSLLGKLLRIDVNGTTSTKAYRIPSTNPYVGKTGLDEIWDRGLRNPWRFSFDKANGNLWIGDVGQNAWEEVDRAPHTTTGAGWRLNWGWRIMEGRHCYNPPTGCNTTGLTFPPIEYDHSNGRCAVTGGYVYRGASIPALVGGYLFGDYCSGEIWVTTATSSSVAPKVLLLDTNMLVSSFGEDGGGELYVCNLNGSVSKVVQG